MKQLSLRKILSFMLIFVMIATMLPLSALPIRAAATTYTLDVSKDLPAIAAGEKDDGDYLKAGTNDYFTVIFSSGSKIDGSNKTFSDGYSATQRFNYQGKTQLSSMTPSVSFVTSGPATVKIWWVAGGDARNFAIFNADGTIHTQTDTTGVVKNGLHISELAVTADGTYYLGCPNGSNYLFRLDVTETSDSGSTTERADWSTVAVPVITEAADNGSGEIKVTVTASVGTIGGDELLVTMYNAAGKKVDERSSVLNANQHTVRFAPTASGTYSFKATLKREGESAKTGDAASASFTLPLAVPFLSSATNTGGGKISLVWGSVAEAEKYEILVDGVVKATTTKTTYTISGLTIGQKYSFRIRAIRGNVNTTSDVVEATVTKEEQRIWGFTTYGPSSKAANNGYVGSINEDGKVTVFSENGAGKITSTTDGIAFYYTAVPTKYNFTLRATVTVDSWAISNGQEGFGLMVADRLGTNGDSAHFWNNQYMAAATKIEYRYDADAEVANTLDGTGTKYTMKLGLGILAKTGVTKSNLAKLEANDSDTINNQFSSLVYTLESSAGEWGKASGSYNIVGNYTNNVTGDIEREMKTQFILEIQKNNTGYFITYYDTDGTILSQKKFYDPDALSQLDSDYVYAGFFAARNARATFSDVTFTTILASEDAPAEEKPVVKIDPSVSVSSATVTTSLDYELVVDANVSGTLQITVAGQVVAEKEVVTGGVRYRKTITLPGYGNNRIQLLFTPDPDQDLGPDTVLSSTKNISTSTVVTANKGMYHRKTIYVSPTGLPNGNGTREYPFDIYTAVDNVVAGQTIVLMEGTYKLSSTLKIQRGMDGTADAMIRMIADPDATTRPVLDFQQLSSGIVHGGDYWYFYGFDVTRSMNGQKGFQVSGNYNVLDQIHTYYNGNTGIQISRYSGNDLFDEWPCYNLILNCTSYGNADAGYEDADGFAAKLTIGEGNVFDGCVAYNNADDGWDLYAKVETGCIGSVTIRNCVAYSNGILADGTLAGNGNGFKLGGESLSGKHVLENCYAFFNKAKGIDSNSCPDIIVQNCISYNNGSYNVAFYTNNAANTAFKATGIISFKDSTIPFADGLSIAENLKGKGTQKDADYLGKTNYYWQGSSCVNASGTKLTSSIFVSLEFKGITRNADGTINMQGFLELTDSAPSNAGARPAGTASGDVSIQPEDQEHNYSDVWFNEDSVYHWHECECGDRTDMGEHTLEWILDVEPTETTPGSKHQQCSICGHKKPAVSVYYSEMYPENQPTETPSTTPTESSAPVATTPGDVSANPNGGMIAVIVIVAVVLLGGGAAAVIVLKKKKGA